MAAVGIGLTPGAYAAPRLGPSQAGTKSLAVNPGLDLLRDRLGATRTALSLTRPGRVQAPRGLSTASVATAPVGAGPIDDAVDQATDTIYVVNGGPSGGGTGKTMSVVDGRTCRAADISRCEHSSPAVTVGAFPVALAVDETTETVYVANANDNTVSVVDGVTCNAQVRTGCNQTPPKVRVGAVPTAVAVDPANHTAYVVNAGGNDVSMINTLTCNASNLTGCHTQHPPTVGVGIGPAWAAVDQMTHTVYVTNDNAVGSPTFNNGTTVSVFDASTCNATTQTGCSNQGLLTVGTGPSAIAVDESRNTIYTVNIGSNTVSVTDGRTCDAADLAGCAAETSGTVTVGAAPNAEALDSGTHTLYVSNNDDDTLSVINTNVCNGRHLSACSGLVPPTLETGDAPNGAAVDPSTHTVYVPNGVDNDVSVIDTRLCDAADTAGCRHPTPSVPEPEYLMTADPATDTIYATDYELPQIDVLNGATCDPSHVSGCAAVAEIPIAAFVGAIDDATHTLYASVYTGSNQVAAIDTATCNAKDTAGCGAQAPTMTIGPGLHAPALNPATDALYVPFGQRDQKVAVLNAATCNAEVTSGCGQKPAVARVGVNTPDLAVSVKTDTVYAPSFTTGGSVAVINGATCNGTDHSGCGHLAATVKVGLYPYGVAVDDATHTVYVANNTNGDTPGTVSVINAATCNGSDTAGCKGRMPTIVVGRSPLLVALNARTDTLYVSDFSSAAVSVVNGSKCNAEVTRGCRKPAPERAVGSQPYGLAINPRNRTVYVADLLGEGALSIFNGRP